MAEARKERHRGLHFRSEDGSVYFIRDEVLQACKVSDDELEGAERDLRKSGKEPAIRESVYIERDMPPLQFTPIDDDASLETAKPAPTIMCCW
jgi:hypothetical protein